MPRMRDRVATQRYEIGMPEVGMPKARLSAPPNQAAFSAEAYGASSAAALGNLSGPLNKLAIAAYAKQDEYDKLRVEDANNQYQQAMLNYTQHPENGVFNTRKGYGAYGMTQDVEKESAKIREQISKDMKLSKRQLGLFGLVADKSSMPYFKGAMDKEATEYQAYRTGVYEAGQKTNIEAIMANPADQTMYETQRDIMKGMAAQQFGDELSDEQLGRYMDEMMSGVEAERIKAIELNDPYAAKAMIDNSKDLLPTAKLALNKLVNEDIETLEVQDIVAEYLDAHGTGDPTASYKWARDTFSGSKEEKVVSSLREQIGERDITENRAEAESKQRSNEQYSYLQTTYWDNGFPAPKEQIALLPPKQQQAALNRNYTLMTRAGIKKYLRMTNPDYIHMSFEEQEALDIQFASLTNGMTDAERQRVLDDIDIGIANGTVTAEEIKQKGEDFYLTANEVSNRLEALSKITKDEQTYIDKSASSIATDIKAILTNLNRLDATEKNVIALQAKDDFTLLMAGLDKDAPDYKEQVKALRVQVVTAAYEKTKAAQPGGFGARLEPDFAAWKEYVDSQTIAPLNLGLKRADFSIDEYRESMPVAVTGVSASSSDDFLAQQFPGGIVTSNYGDQGPNRSEPHTGTDIAAPAGTPINFVFDVGDWTVTAAKNANDKNAGGNRKLIDGIMPNGDTASLYFMHMESLNDGVKVGEKVLGNSLIGKTGNTGRVRGKNGGYHTHVQAMINGRIVNYRDVFIPYMMAMKTMPTQKQQQMNVWAAQDQREDNTAAYKESLGVGAL